MDGAGLLPLRVLLDIAKVPMVGDEATGEFTPDALVFPLHAR